MVKRIFNDDVKRFWSKVERSTTCWFWRGATDGLGYSSFWKKDRMVKGYRFAYELLRGPVPEGLELDHLCRNTICVNPEHLEAVTHRENMIRGNGFSGTSHRKTHCPRGHPLIPGNLVPYALKKGLRTCLICRNDYMKIYGAIRYQKSQEKKRFERANRTQ